MTTYCENCGSVMPTTGSKCLNCGAEVGDANPPYSMKWYRLLTKFLLPIGAALIILIGMVILLGLPYILQGSDSTLVYAQAPLLMVIDTVFGTLCIVLSVLYLITRSRLVRFRKSGPTLVCISYGLSMLLPVVYCVVTNYFFYPIGTPLLGISEVGELLAMLVGIVLNAIYFRNRQHMFDTK